MLKRTGFTLIELLVVVAIIAVLVAILLPALNYVRFQTRTMTCLSSMRQVGIGLAYYQNDYQGRCFPNGWTDWPPWRYYTKFHQKIEPYLKNRSIFACPEILRYYTVLPEGRCSDYISSLVCDKAWSSCPDPSGTVALYEGDAFPWDSYLAGWSGIVSGITGGVHGGSNAIGEVRMSNFLAIDGHSETLPTYPDRDASRPMSSHMALQGW